MAQVEVPNRSQLLTAGNWQEVRNDQGQLTGYNLVDNKGAVVDTISSTMGPQYVGPETVANPFGNGTYEINWGENNAMQTILGRGRKADGTWDIGGTQWLMGNNITQQQMDDFQTLQAYNTLSSQFDKDLIANGLNPVSFGEGQASVQRRLNQAVNRPEAERTERQRVEALQGQKLSAANQGIRADNADATTIQSSEKDRKERETIREEQALEAQRGRDFQIGMQGLKNDAEMARYEKELARFERQDRRDNISALIAGLATLGAGFAM